MKTLFARPLELAVAALLTALCLALPTRNPSGDAWYYAACSRWGHELLQPHHLLYNVVGWGWLHLAGATGPAPAGLAALPWLQALNALAAGGCLLALAPLLRRAGTRPAAVPAWLLLVGSCFGLLRFAVENEAYVQPLLLALLASGEVAHYWLLTAGCSSIAGSEGPLSEPATGNQPQKASNQQPAAKNLFLAGLLAVLAVLLHQVLVWWWLALLLWLRPWHLRRAALTYAAPALLIPLAYALAAPEPGPFGAIRFALHDYLTGAARVELGWRNLLLTPIGLVRTLVQVHGNLLPLLRRWPLPLGVVALGCAALAGYGLWGIVRPPAPVGAAPAKTLELPYPARRRATAVARRVRRTHLLIFALQLAFAAQAAGNAEFMVMLPALAAVALAGGAGGRWPIRRIAALGLALLAWNLAFGLLPAHFLVYTDAGPALRARVLAEPQAWYVLADPNPLRNQLHYFTGQPEAPPQVIGVAGQDSARFRQWLGTRLAAGDAVYTDALGGPRLLDRARLTLGDPAARLLAGLTARRVAVLPTFFGPYYVSRLTWPADSSSAICPNASASAGTNTGAAR